MFEQILYTEHVEVLTFQAPASQTVAQTLTRVKADKHTRIAVELWVGAMTATATLDMTVKQATLVTAGTLKNITNKAGGTLGFTQITQAGSGSNKIYVVEFRTGALDPAFPWIDVVVTPAVAAVIFGITVKGIDPKYAPVTQTNWAQANF